MTHTPLVYAETEARSTSYLRTTVLDRVHQPRLAALAAQPSRRERRRRRVPQPAGPGARRSAASRTTGPSSSRPTSAPPGCRCPTRSASSTSTGSWRYDSRTLDVAYVGGGSASELSYRATSFTPAITAELLEHAVRGADRDPHAP